MPDASPFVWILVIWLLTVSALIRFVVRPAGQWPLSPLLGRCLLLVLLSTQTGAVSDTLNTIDIFTVIRGLLVSVALVFAVRALLVNGRQGRARGRSRRQCRLAQHGRLS